MKNSHHLCELLTPILPQEATEFLSSERYAMQIKEDGFRLVVERYMGGIFAFDRKNQITAVRTDLVNDLNALGEDYMLDGELVGEGEDHRYIVWDLLRWEETDLRNQPYAVRFATLQYALAQNPGSRIQAVRSWDAPEVKRRLLKKLYAEGIEGVCFKDRLAIWQPGRARQHYKLKFWESATCRVADKLKRADAREDKHSIALELQDASGNWKPMGFVTIPPKHDLPSLGTLVEVRYLYAQTDGLYQPVFLGVRKDLDESACTLGQLKWRQDYGKPNGATQRDAA